MREIAVTIHEDEVLYDIGMNVFTIGERMVAVDDKLKFNVQAGLDGDNRNLVIREISKAWQEVLQTLSAYTTKPDVTIAPIVEQSTSQKIAINNVLKDTAFATTLYFANNTPSDIGENIVQAIHAYLVSMGSALWLKRTYPDESKIFQQEATEGLINVKRIASNRTRPIRTVGYGF